jgi:hypothetical protein
VSPLGFLITFLFFVGGLVAAIVVNRMVVNASTRKVIFVAAFAIASLWLSTRPLGWDAWGWLVLLSAGLLSWTGTFAIYYLRRG